MMKRPLDLFWKCCLGLALFWACSGASPVWAQSVYIDITQPNFASLPIAVPDFKYQNPADSSLAHKLAQTLSNDLDYSGVFRTLDSRGFLENPQKMGVTLNTIKFSDWRQLGAEFLVRGVCQVQGSSLRLEMRLFDVVAARMVVGKIYEGQTKDWLTMIHRFANEILLALTGQKGVFGTKIAYVEARGKHKEIHLVDFDGNNPIQVTHDRSIDLSPTWSPDGTKLAYVSFKDGGPKIFVLNLMTGAQRLLCGYPGLNIAPAWRPGADQLAVTLSKDGSPSIYLVSAASGKILHPLVHNWAISVSPSWSPDGKRLAYVSDETGNPQVYVLDVATGKKQRITYNGTYNTSPCWSPKGDWIAFSGIQGGHHNIFIIHPDGSGLQQLTQGEGNNENPTWSPDGRMLAYSSTRQGRSSIWVQLINGTGVRRLTQPGALQELPSWSPRLQGR